MTSRLHELHANTVVAFSRLHTEVGSEGLVRRGSTAGASRWVKAIVKKKGAGRSARNSLIRMGRRGAAPVGAGRRPGSQGYPPFERPGATRGVPNYWPLEKWEEVYGASAGCLA